MDLILPFFAYMGLEDTLLDPTISDIMITPTGKVYLDIDGVITERTGVQVQRAYLESAIEIIAQQLGDNISHEKPFLDARLEDGSRVAAVYPPASPMGPTLTIRKFIRQFTVDELIERSVMPMSVAMWIEGAIKRRKNGIVSGGTGSGKTTVLNSLLRLLDKQERLVIIEKPIEMKVDYMNVDPIRWEARDKLPGQPEITVTHLLKAALRHRPDRIIVGEVRDGSAFDMLQAMNTGHSGTLSTIHADSHELALNRIASLAREGFGDIETARQETASAIHYVLHLERFPDGARRVTGVVQVLGYSHETRRFQTDRIF